VVFTFIGTDAEAQEAMHTLAAALDQLYQEIQKGAIAKPPSDTQHHLQNYHRQQTTAPHQGWKGAKGSKKGEADDDAAHREEGGQYGAKGGKVVKGAKGFGKVGTAWGAESTGSGTKGTKGQKKGGCAQEEEPDNSYVPKGAKGFKKGTTEEGDYSSYNHCSHGPKGTKGFKKGAAEKGDSRSAPGPQHVQEGGTEEAEATYSKKAEVEAPYSQGGKGGGAKGLRKPYTYAPKAAGKGAMKSSTEEDQSTAKGCKGFNKGKVVEDQEIQQRGAKGAKSYKDVGGVGPLNSMEGAEVGEGDDSPVEEEETPTQPVKGFQGKGSKGWKKDQGEQDQTLASNEAEESSGDKEMMHNGGAPAPERHMHVAGGSKGWKNGWEGEESGSYHSTGGKMSVKGRNKAGKNVHGSAGAKGFKRGAAEEVSNRAETTGTRPNSGKGSYGRKGGKAAETTEAGEDEEENSGYAKEADASYDAVEEAEVEDRGGEDEGGDDEDQDDTPDDGKGAKAAKSSSRDLAKGHGMKGQKGSTWGGPQVENISHGSKKGGKGSKRLGSQEDNSMKGSKVGKVMKGKHEEAPGKGTKRGGPLEEHSSHTAKGAKSSKSAAGYLSGWSVGRPHGPWSYARLAEEPIEADAADKGAEGPDDDASEPAPKRLKALPKWSGRPNVRPPIGLGIRPRIAPTSRAQSTELKSGMDDDADNVEDICEVDDDATR